MAEATYTGRRIGTRGLVAIESRHTLEIGIMGLVGGMGLMGEVGRDGGGKNAAGVHGGSGLGIRGGRWLIFSDFYAKQSKY